MWNCRGVFRTLSSLHDEDFLQPANISSIYILCSRGILVNSDLYNSKLLWPYSQFTSVMDAGKRGIFQDWTISFFCNWRLCTETATGSTLLQKSDLKIFEKFSGKHLCQSLFFDKVTGLGPATLFKKRFWQRCFRKTPPGDCFCF